MLLQIIRKRSLIQFSIELLLMSQVKKYNFTSTIKSSGNTGGAYVEFPFDVFKEFKAKGKVKVICYFENIEYRGLLVKMGTICHIIGITKEIRNKLGKSVGDSVNVKLSVDTDERTVVIPEPLLNALNKNKSLLNKFKSLSLTSQKEYALKINSAKKEETLKKRLDSIISELKLK